jgi:hypothetical protein
MVYALDRYQDEPTDIDVRDPERYRSYVMTLASQQKVKMQGRNFKIRDLYDHRYGRHTVAVPDAFKATAAEYKSPLIGDLIDRAVAITHDFPRPSVTPRKRLGPRAQENASLREKWAIGWLTRANRTKDVWGMIRDSTYSEGAGVWKVLFREHYWTSYGLRRHDESAQEYNSRVQEHREQHFPFVWEHVETSSFYPVAEDEDGLCEALEITRRETLPMMKRYGLSYTSKDGFYKAGVGMVLNEPGAWGALPDTVEFMEYWDREVFCYIVAGVIVKAGYHDYGRPPYFYAMAVTTGSKNPTDQYTSPATKLIPIQDIQDSFATIRMNWAYINGFPAARLVPVNDEIAMDVPDVTSIKYVPGETIQAPAGYRWEWAPAPPVGEDLRFMSEWMEAQADKYSLAPILHGSLLSGVSGVATLQAVTLAKSLFAPGLGNLARAMNETMAFVLYMIEHVIECPVPLYYQGDGKWLELGPRDIDGYYEFNFQIEPTIMQERIAKTQWLADLEARGFVTALRVLEEGAGIHDPEEELAAVDLQRFRQRGDYQNGVMQEAMRQLELEGFFTPPQPTPEQQAAVPVSSAGPGIPQQAGIGQPMPQTQPGQEGQMAQPNAAMEQARSGGTPRRMY